MSCHALDSLTLLIHGTFDQKARWYRPGGAFHRYVRRIGGHDVYAGDDFFCWSGERSDRARRRGAEELVAWCRAHPARRLRLWGHSHGASVACLATQLGLEVEALVLLSPPVMQRYLPNLERVTTGRLFTVHPWFDMIVSRIARADRTYQQFDGVAERECVASSGPAGHWSSVSPARWELFRVAAQWRRQLPTEPTSNRGQWPRGELSLPSVLLPEGTDRHRAAAIA